MPSTACSCIGHLRRDAFDVEVADPTCRIHGEPATAPVAPASSAPEDLSTAQE